jgi:four helix bundle protein
MDAVIDLPERDETGASGGRRMRAFRATDHFVLSVYQAVRGFTRPEADELSREIRRAVARCGGALVGASASPDDDPDARRALAAAHRGLLEIRYFLYLARRLGCLDLKRYKQLATLQDAALRELAQLLA